MSETDTLTTAIADWVSWVATQLNAQHADLLRVCLHTEGTDVLVRMKAGTIALACRNDATGQVIELYQESVEPLKPTVRH